ncbi:hypothetical protein ACLOJK_038761 [Asimina triloba]
MAQAYRREEEIHESTESEAKTTSSSSATTPNASFKFNAQAPEFVPRAQAQMPVPGYLYPCFHFIGSSGSDWFYVGGQEPIQLFANSNVAGHDSSKNILSNDLKQKIIKQAEYQFSDASLIANESLTKLMGKDAEGYVPISFVASTKKMKSLINNNQLMAIALRGSTKLVVSDDGKKVKRKHPFTERDKEELQSRIVVVENLPEDYSHQNIEKIFGVVGRSYQRVYQTSESLNMQQVEKLNDERNWRKGLRVRMLLRRSPRPVMRNRKSEYDHFDGNSDNDKVLPPPSETLEDVPRQISCEQLSLENIVDDSANNSKKGWARGRGKARGRSQSHNGRGLLLAPSPQPSSLIQSEASSKQIPRGPRMPDGTRGFTMGRGKPMASPLPRLPLD